MKAKKSAEALKALKALCCLAPCAREWSGSTGEKTKASGKAGGEMRVTWIRVKTIGCCSWSKDCRCLVNFRQAKQQKAKDCLCQRVFGWA